MKKICPKCNKEKPLDEFYRYKRVTCKKCHISKYAKEWRKDNAERLKEYYRKWRKLNPLYKAEYFRKHPEKRSSAKPGYNEYQLRYQSNKANYFKVRVRQKLREAVKNGKIAKGGCEIRIGCQGRIEGHHEDYNKPYEVQWLCKRHHEDRHLTN
jgi:hypothetical protein